MSCECLKVIRENLNRMCAADGESDVCLQLVSVINMETSVISMKLPPLNYSYKTKRKKRKKGVVWFTFCPFCGVKL